MELSLVGRVKILNLKRGSNAMKPRICRLEFGINCLADIRFLYYAWDWLWTQEGGAPPHTILPYITIEDRLPGEQVSLNFTASMEVLDRFMCILEQDGLKSSRDDLIPNFLILCRIDKDQGGLRVIGGNDAHGSDKEAED
jgi:hypothetical protein